MKIGIDIDNVIANTYKDLAGFFHDFMGREIDPADIVEFFRHEKIKVWHYFFEAWRKKVMTKISLIKGSQETIQAWSKEHQIHLVTSRFPLFNRQTKAWLKKHAVPYHGLHHAKETKKHLKAKNCQIFIEDNLDECEILADHCEKVFLFDYPWNQKKPSKNNIVRVKDWTEIFLPNY